MHANSSAVMETYDPTKLKKLLSRVNAHIDWYNGQPEYKKAKIFGVVEENPNDEMIRRFENYHDVKIIGIAECGQNLHLTLYDPNLDKILLDCTKLKNSQTSTTVQNLGISIAEKVMARSKEEGFKSYITQQMVNTAARTKYTLERKMILQN